MIRICKRERNTARRNGCSETVDVIPAAAGVPDSGRLLRFLLFLLTDADLVHRHLRVFESFMIVTSNGVGEE